METTRILCCSKPVQQDITSHESVLGIDRIAHIKNHEPDDLIKAKSYGSDDDEISDCDVVNDNEVKVECEEGQEVGDDAEKVEENEGHETLEKADDGDSEDVELSDEEEGE